MSTLRIRKRYFKTLETSVINSTMSPPSLIKIKQNRKKCLSIDIPEFDASDLTAEDDDCFCEDNDFTDTGLLEDLFLMVRELEKSANSRNT